MEAGENADYRWLICESHLGDLLKRCPEIILGRHVAITAFDSGPLTPTPDEEALGWRLDGRVAWSPNVLQTSVLPYEGYDEWYVFPSVIAFQPHEIFVNRGRWELQDPSHMLENLEPTWDRACVIEKIGRVREIQERFWSQLALIRPESYLADGDNLIFVTRNAELFTSVVASMKAY